MNLFLRKEFVLSYLMVMMQESKYQETYKSFLETKK